MCESVRETVCVRAHLHTSMYEEVLRCIIHSSSENWTGYRVRSVVLVNLSGSIFRSEERLNRLHFSVLKSDLHYSFDLSLIYSPAVNVSHKYSITHAVDLVQISSGKDI